MPIYEFAQRSIVALAKTTFSSAGLRERQDIQRLLLSHIDVIAPDTFVLSDEFGDWKDSRHRIDILAVDKSANLVVIELKRTEDGGHIELQAIRYAAMVSSMTFEKAVEVHTKYLRSSATWIGMPNQLCSTFLSGTNPTMTTSLKTS